MKLGIVISTYMRKDGSTPAYLTRTLDSVFNQTYQDFKVFLIGDKYENQNEIESIVAKYPKEKIYFENLPIAQERDNYLDKMVLWSYGGVNATNHGIERCLSEGIDFICHLDHDDLWLENHLEEIVNCLKLHNVDWVCTKSTYFLGWVLPRIESEESYLDFYPESSKLIHSSVCMNFKKIPLRYRDIFLETGKLGLPSDADLWERTRNFMLENNIKGKLINKLTCKHEQEGFERTV